LLLHAPWHSLILFTVCNKSAGSLDLGFGRDGVGFRNYSHRT